VTFDISKIRIGVIGLGYVGLPLAVEFGRKYPTVGFDVKASRVKELKAGKDSTLEVSPEELAESKHLSFTSDASGIADCNFFIVTVPTPIGDGNRPFVKTRRHGRTAKGGGMDKSGNLGLE
jgi:UDP-N-acetyl-D-galactosamine dehydrogenase